MKKKIKLDRILPAFGVKGWMVTIAGILCIYMMNGPLVGGTNTIFSLFNEWYGWTVTQMSFGITLGGWLSVVGIMLFGMLCRKKGAKFVTVVSLAGVAVALALFAAGQTLTFFLISCILSQFFSVGYSVISVGQYGADWFPTKKGLYMGFAGMGMVISGATINLLLLYIFPSWGVRYTMLLFVGYLLVVILFVTLLTKNTPEEAGAFPDNDRNFSRERLAGIRAKSEDYRKTSPWDTKKVLRTPQTWIIAIGWGIAMLAASGSFAHLVPTLVYFGHSPMMGIILLASFWWVGLASNWILGILDVNIGTKKASLVVLCVELITLLIIIFFGSNPVLASIAVWLLLFSVSGLANMNMSVTSTVWGRYDFGAAWPVVSVIFRVVHTSGVLIIAAIADKAGYMTAYAVLAGLVVVAGVIMATLPNKCIGGVLDEDMVAAGVTAEDK